MGAVKTCSVCNVTKGESEFYRHTRGGLFGKCKSCAIDYGKRRHKERYVSTPRKPALPYRRAFTQQRRSARDRGIRWEFTYEQWLKVWISSGKLDERGTGANGYVMARYGDIGPYSPDNVYIATNVQNMHDYYAYRKMTYPFLFIRLFFAHLSTGKTTGTNRQFG